MIRPYLSNDIHLINSWLKARDMKSINPLELPMLGYAYIHKSNDDNYAYKPIAFGFLRQAEGGVGIMDSFVTDPEASKEDRHKAMDSLADHLVETAPSFGIHKLIGFTKDTHTLERAIKHGFEVPVHRLIVKGQ